jgi:hypothetical protein
MFAKLVKTLTTVILFAGMVGWAPSGSRLSKDSSNLADLNRLIGTWTRTTKSGEVFEIWTRVSERTLEGLAYRTKDGEKTVTEYLRLEQFGSEIFYTAKPPQNPYPVAFKLATFADNIATFENPHHDFPQRIIYTFKEDGSLHARIEGPQDGETVGIDFVFTRAKD